MKNRTNYLPLHLALAAFFALAVGSHDANAQTRPAWCPSPLYNGFTFQFVENTVYPGRPIQQSVQYSARLPRPTSVTINWSRGYTKGASVTIGLGTEVGNAAFGSVKANIDSSISKSVTVQQGWSQTIPVPANRRVMWFWGVDMRRTVVRTRFVTPGCRVYRDYGNQTVIAPRSGSIRPQARIVY